MRITRRVMATVLAVSIGIMFLGLLFFAWFFIDHALRVEQEALGQRLRAVDHYFQDQGQIYRVMASEYAEGYDDLGRIGGQNPGTADRFLSRLDLRDLDAHFILIVSPENEVLASVYQQGDDGQLTTLTAVMRRALVRDTEGWLEGQAEAFFWTRSAEVFRLGMAPLSPEGSDQGGRLIVGRHLNQSFQEQLQGFMQAPFSIRGQYPDGFEHFADRGDHALHVDSVLTSDVMRGVLTLQQDPLVALTIELSRDAFLQQRASLLGFLIAFFFFATGAVILSTHLTSQRFLRPIEKLSESIPRQDPEQALPLEISGHSCREMKSLTSSINAMMATIRQEKIQLAESERFLRTFFEQSPLGIVISRHRRQIERVNPEFCRIVGYSKEELESMTFDDLHHPEEKDLKFPGFHRLAVNIDEQFRLERRYVRKDGQTIWIQMTVTRLDDLPVEQTQFICMVEDISERKAQVAALSESERSKDVLLQNLPGMAYRALPQPPHAMSFVSQGCQELTGYPAEKLTAMSTAYRDLILPEERAIVQGKWQDALRQGQTFRMEYPLQTAGGDIKWVYEQGVGVEDEDGRLQALEGLIIDVTTRKAHERRIEYLNQRDVLTGLYNRRYYEQALLDFDHEQHLPLSIMIGDINGLKLANDAFGHLAGDHLIRTAGRLLRTSSRLGDVVARTGGDEFTLLLPQADEQEAHALMQTIKAKVQDYNAKADGQDVRISLALGFATRLSMDESLVKTLDKAEDYMRKRKLLESRSSQSSVIASIVATLNERSQETEEHGERLARLSHSIGKRLGLSQIDLDKLVLLARLHDIGKINIDNATLNKPGPLSDEEWGQMRKHPQIGYRIAAASPELMSIADMILTHHERWDGSGYPQGLSGESIPLLSRILSIADAFDAMVQDRPYRKAMTQVKALQEIERGAGSQFDPQIAAVFVAMMREKAAKSSKNAMRP